MSEEADPQKWSIPSNLADNDGSVPAGSFDGVTAGSFDGVPAGSFDGVPAGSFDGVPAGSFDGAAPSLASVSGTTTAFSEARNTLATPSIAATSSDFNSA